MKHMVEALKALSDMTRLKILTLVSTRELCVCELTQVLRVSSSCVSQHLTKLKAADLVEERRDAQWVFYKAKPEVVRSLAMYLLSLASTPLSDIEGMHPEAERYARLDEDPRIRQCKTTTARAEVDRNA